MVGLMGGGVGGSLETLKKKGMIAILRDYTGKEIDVKFLYFSLYLLYVLCACAGKYKRENCGKT
jgi:hypothetical protein